MGMAESGGATKTADLISRMASKWLPDHDLAARLRSPIVFIPTRSGRTAYGYEATVLADICDFMLRARDDGILTARQELLAAQCEILARGFMHVGIVALVDEATGYQNEWQVG